MKTYRQKMEAEVRKLKIQVHENAALRKENTMLIESLKKAQQRAIWVNKK
jgi:NADH:ubiquinone oxidoreductase subunit E